MYNDNSRNSGYYQQPRQPVTVGEEIDVKIEGVGEKGDGIAKKDGFVIFVPNVQKDQEVRVKVTKVLRKVGFGEVIGDAQGPVASSGNSEETQDVSKSFSL